MLQILKSSTEDWLARERSSIEPAAKFLQWQAERYGQQNTFDDYIADLERRRKDGVLPTITLDDQSTWELVSRYLQGTDRFGLSLNGVRVPVEFRGKHITQLHIQNSKDIALESCEVLDLIIGIKDFHINNVELRGCKIHRLTLGGKIHRLEIRNTKIQDLRLGGESGPQIYGPVDLRKVKFSDDHAQLQHFRTLRKKLTEIHSLDAAGIVHAAELKISGKTLGFLDGMISDLYAVGSKYGTDSSRALLCMALAIGSNVLFLWLSDGTTVSRNLVGWQEFLDGRMYSGLLRASYLAVGQTFNPGGLFGPLSLVVTTNPLVGIVSTVLGLLGTAALALFLLAIRRKFRLDG
jgi:hypothetical protein